MDDIEVVLSCPLGSTCRKVVDNKIHQCAWYVKIEGTNPQTGKDVSDSKCAIAWQPILSVAQASEIRSTGATLQSLRNESIKRQNVALEAMRDAKIITD